MILYREASFIVNDHTTYLLNLYIVNPYSEINRPVAIKYNQTEFNWIEDLNETNLTVRIKKSNSTISLKSADQPDALRGTGINFLILDEFADIDKRTWFEVLRASISDTMGNVLFTGTPRGYGNWSYEMYLKGKQDKEWESFQFTTLQGGMVHKEELEQAQMDLDVLERFFSQYFCRFWVVFTSPCSLPKRPGIIVFCDVIFSNFLFGKIMLCK